MHALALFLRCTAMACVPACGIAAAESVRWMAPTSLQQDGSPVSLEVVIETPAGAGPFPVVLFNHGSTGRGDDASLFARTWTSAAVTSYFNQRGWAVVYPQRRGRGQSQGLYDEGFEANRSRYSCDPARSLPGLQRAVQDVQAVLEVLHQRPELDTRRMLVGGQSRGGLLAVVLAGEHPDRFVGVVNFVGGWISDRCANAAQINHVSLARGAKFARTTLWMYGDADPFYSLQHSRSGFAAFQAAGGKGSFQDFRLAPGTSGHLLVNHPATWAPAVTEYLQRLD